MAPPKLVDVEDEVQSQTNHWTGMQIGILNYDFDCVQIHLLVIPSVCIKILNKNPQKMRVIGN